MKIFVSIALLILIATGEIRGQTPVLVQDAEFQKAAQMGIDSLYNRNPGAAREVMEPWKQDNPDHPVWLLWEAMEHWWVVLTDLYDHSHDEELFEKMEKADDAAVRLLDEHPDHADGHIIRAVANGYIARQHANRHRWVRSVRTARAARKAHRNLAEIAPDLADNLFAEGLEKYYSAYLPEAYTVVRAVSWLLPEGDKQKGLELLDQTSREAVFARPEAIYFLGVILLNYENEYESAQIHFRTLAENYPNNSFYRRLLVRTLYQNYRDREAEEAIDQALQHWQTNGFQDQQVLREELLYWRGRNLMRMGQHRQAHEALTESYRLGRNLPNHKKRSFHVLSGYYAGVTAERIDDFESARNYYSEVSRLEGESDVRERAKARLSEL